LATIYSRLPNIRLMVKVGPLLPILGCDAAIMGSPPAAQAWSVGEQYEDFVYDLVSTSVDRDLYPRQNGAVCASKFADLVFARLEK
jgi:hypothetical protein